MEALSIIALYVGWTVLAAAAVIVAGVAIVFVWSFFPARFDWRKTYGATVTTRYGAYPLLYWIGVSGRRDGPQWFIGFLRFGRLGEQPPQGGRIITPKPTPGGTHD